VGVEITVPVVSVSAKSKQFKGLTKEGLKVNGCKIDYHNDGSPAIKIFGKLLSTVVEAVTVTDEQLKTVT
jgi:hypothetical protein